MKFGILEIVGLFLIVIGCGSVVGAASLVSIALAVLTAGVFLMFAGVLVVYVAATLSKVPPPKPTVGDRG